MGASDPLRLFWLLWLFMGTMAAGRVQGQMESSTIWSFSRPNIWLRPYDWTYLRVDVPLWFSSITMIFTTSVQIDKEQLKKIPKSMLPVLCFNQGRLPLPDVSDAYLDSLLSNFIANGTFDGAQYLPNLEQCIPFQKNLTITLTKDKVSPGQWYIGFFNGLGPERTQSKMISRGHSYTISASINVEGCDSSTTWGAYCNNTFDMISCSQSSNYNHPRNLLDVNLYNSRNLKYDNYVQNPVKRRRVAINSNISLPAELLVSCNNSLLSCIGNGELKVYSLDIVVPVAQFSITVAELMLNQTSVSNGLAGSEGILVMCYARYNAMPLSSVHDYSAEISRNPLIVNSPRIGQWFVALQVLNQKKIDGEIEGNFSLATLCFSLEWLLYQCSYGKAGQNCTWESHALQGTMHSCFCATPGSKFRGSASVRTGNTIFLHYILLSSNFFLPGTINNKKYSLCNSTAFPIERDRRLAYSNGRSLAGKSHVNEQPLFRLPASLQSSQEGFDDSQISAQLD
ncbi:uncharacterized protein LOC110032068 [Phalaenopsis equestris]|uniref:uncharacterized protein LOC110032068 n=1 Tax=Phalaenopsis equestris TaxID=78828 RepID=UPI0009E25B51|nr:uncharacterized protein LOC110032068 [Phalaenopsis equestris]